jgi:hypothetical protein
MPKKLALAATFIAFGVFALPASAATFSINEPLATPGELNSSWTVSGKDFTPSIVTNAGDSPENALRLTDAGGFRTGFVLYNTPISTNNGIDITFNQAQWGGSGADGIVFFVKNAANTSNIPGATGGGLGYAPYVDVSQTLEGMPGALLGIGLDSYGMFGAPSSGGTGCDTPFTGTGGGGGANAITLRGPGNGLNGYCLLADSYRLVPSGKQPIINSYSSREQADRKVRVVIDAATKTDPKVTVYYQDEQIIQVALPEAFTDVSNVKIGFSAGTGGATNNHEVWGLVSQAADPNEEEPVEEEPVENGTPEEELAATGADSVALWFGFALAMVLMALGGFAIRRSTRS